MDTCPNCGGEYERLSSHWKSCGFPELTNRQRRVATGVMMGDGGLLRNGSNASVRVTNIQKEYLEYLDDIFGPYGTSVTIKRTAEEAASDNRKYLDVDAEASDYNDIYVWQTRRAPVFEEYRSWYSTGEKIFPESINIKPEILKHWYVCDGHLRDMRGVKYPSISVSNEKNNPKKLISYFDESPVSPSGIHATNLYFPKYSIDSFFEYIGEPIPGFEEKWPGRYRQD